MARSLLFLLCLGCATLGNNADPRSWPPGAVAAVDAALSCAGVARRPRVLFITEGLDCREGRGFRAATMGGGCVGGIWAPGALTIAHRAGDRFSDGALPEETAREAANQRTGAVYQDYGPEWQSATEAIRVCMRAAGH